MTDAVLVLVEVIVVSVPLEGLSPSWKVRESPFWLEPERVTVTGVFSTVETETLFALGPSVVTVVLFETHD